MLLLTHDDSLEFAPDTVRYQSGRNFEETTLRNHRLMREILDRAGYAMHARDCRNTKAKAMTVVLTTDQ